MYGTICEISGPSALNGLSHLSKLIQNILDKTIRNTNERDNAKRDIATIVSNCLPVYLSGSDNDVYPLSALVSDLCSLALLEVEENGKKLNKSQTFRKTCSFELTISTLHRLCEKRLLHCSSDFLPFVSDILTKPFLHSQSWMEDEVTNVLIKFVTLSISTIPQEQIRRLWSVVWSRFSHVIGNSGKSSGNYLRVTVAILRHIHKTDLTLGEYGERLISDLIDNFFAALRRTDMKKWRTQIEYGLQLLVLLIDDWGIEFREKLLDHCLPLASSLVHDLDFSAASPISLNSTWPFFDRLFHLAVPDCKPSCLVRSEAYYLAQSACEVIINSLSSISSNRSDYELQKEYVPLLARLVVIADNNHSNGLDHSVIAYTRNTKRRKMQKFLDVINDWSSVDNTEDNEHRRLVVSWLFVGYEIASRWSHRIESDCLTSMATKLWAGRDRIKLDWQCEPYCRLLDILLRKGALDTLCNEELETVRSLWKFALSSAHARSSFESASSLMISLLKRFPSVIGDESDITDVICDIFSRWSTPHCPVLYNLVSTLLTEFEFDEFAPFPGVTDKKKGLKEWRFRCQIAEWLITNVEPQCSLEELLLLLCSFHPCRTSAVSSVPISKVQIERDLISFGLCEKCILPSDDKPTIPFVVIPEMVDYISGVIKQFWTDQELKNEVRISLWCSYMNFLCKVGSEFCAQNTILLNAMNHWMSTFALEANADVLSQIRAQELSSELIPLDLLTILATRLDDCPSLAMHLLIHEVQLQISSRNIRDVMRCIGQYLDKTDNSKVRYAASRLLEEFTRDVDTVPDLLLLLDECGEIIESRSRIAIAYKILGLIDDDVTADEYDVAQACIYRKLLTTYVMRASKPGGCPSINLKAVSAQCVVRYIDSLPSSVVNWEFVSNLLDRLGSNVILTLKLVNRLLLDPTKYDVHPRILGVVLKNLKLLQACEQFIPNFALILDCHYNSLMLADSSNQRLPYFDVTSPLRNDSFVQFLGNGNVHLIKTDAFPSAFFIEFDVCNRQVQNLITTFWRSFMDDPHEILTSLWKAVRMSIDCNAHLLFLHNLLITARSPQRKALSTSMQKGFDLAIYSIFSTMICAAKIRHPDVVCYIYNQISASKCLSSEDILFLSCAGEDNDSEDREQISKAVNSAVNIFIECGYAKDIRIYHCSLFWQNLHTSLEVQVRRWHSSEPLKNVIISQLLFAWDVLPHFRHLIAPILSLFDIDAETFCVSGFQSHDAVLLIRNYCYLMLSNPRLDSADAFHSCLRILSHDEFADDAILFQAAAKHELQHISAEDISQLPCHLFRDLVVTLKSSMSRVTTMFLVVNECYCYVPKLCQVLAPYILQSDISNYESVVAVLLRYASLVAETDLDATKQCTRRMARCIAECVDSFGLERLSGVKLGNLVCPNGLCALAKCCILADLPHYAFAVANVFYDMLMANEGFRHMAAFGTRLENRQFLELLREIYLALGSTSGLRVLPMDFQNDGRVRALFSKARFDWLGVILTPGTSLQDLIDAYWYCGINYCGSCRRVKYALAVRNMKWDEVSYPKKLDSHEERLFSALYLAGRCERSANKILEFIQKRECENMRKDELSKLVSLEHLRDLAVIRMNSALTNNDILAMADNRLFLLAAVKLRLAERLDSSAAVFGQDLLISTVMKRLSNLKAYVPCFAILEKCAGSFSVLEKCRVYVLKGDYNTAEHLIRGLLDSSLSCEPEVEMEARCLLAELLADHKNMLDEAIVLLREGIENGGKYVTLPKCRFRFFSLLHRLAACQLSGVEEHMESRAFRMRKDAIREWTRQRSFLPQGTQTQAARRIECELRCEKEVVESINRKLVTSAYDTVVAGLEALKLLSQPYREQPNQPKQRNDCILRLIFPLVDVIFRFECERNVVNALREYVANGMVPAIWLQVVSHIMVQCFSKNILATVVRTMVVKLIIAYPFHVLHTVLMYKFDENCSHIVDSMLEEVEHRVADKSARARLRQIIEDMIAAHIAYIQFAALKISDTQFFKKISGVKTAQYQMLETVEIVRMSTDLKRIPLPIVDQKIGNAGDYSGHEIVMWDTMDSTCTRADGLSSPKVLRAKGSDGKWYKLIWKNEDVRQDCLVEQLFSVVSGIMNHDETSSFLRTYKVIPLNSKCGIIEFCQGTISLKELLCGLDLAGGLHAKTEPMDKKALQIRTILKDVAKMPVNQASATFRQACALFKPVFRHFFYHHCRTVNQWTSMIDNYRRSLAQWSIATYVVGLGDRHLSNILFEIDTCKLVHIDLGMILEYSKRTLPIPERVPFRLTRDLLDPILIEGIGGRLLDEAVCAMQLLRENKQVILGLASVLLRETITNFEEVESNNGDRPSFVSETAIARLRDKLNGTDDTFVQQDVLHQVRRLFTEATNVDNISRMFIGWMGFV